MLGLTRKIRTRTAQTLLALVGGLWLLSASAPCVMAMAHCMPGMAGGCQPVGQPGLFAIGDCDTLAVADCQTKGEERLVMTAPIMDFSVIPVQLHTLTMPAALPVTQAIDRYATTILSPPLNLQHAVLLI